MDQERRMDSGEQPFVMFQGHRLAFMQDVLNECGVKSGETIPHAVWIAMLQLTLRKLQAQIAAEKFSEGD